MVGACGGVRDELFPDVIEQALAAQHQDEPWEPDAMAAYCARCGASAGPGSVMRSGCAFCVGESVTWDRITRLGAYAPPLDEYVRRMKFRGQWRWAYWVGDRLAEVVAEPFDASRLVVCPVPMHWTRRWARGFNQASLIAERLAHRRGWRCEALLRRTRATRPQTTVSAAQRLANVRGSAALVDVVDLTGWEVLLVDDVKTSGSTLRVCARSLQTAGARSIHVVVGAVADPQGADFRQR